jgi:hypothetical protein
VDPFLHLVHETKLQAVKDHSEDSPRTYGSPEDDASALKFLSAINLTGSHSRESMTSTIMNTITDLPEVIFHPFFLCVCYTVQIEFDAPYE